MSEAGVRRGIERKLIGLGVGLALVLAVWTGGWLWLRQEVAQRMDLQISMLQAHGLTVTCPDRSIGGWPFRLDIDCGKPTFSQSGRLTTAMVEHLRVTTLVYQPTLIVLELDGPFAATGPNGEIFNATWSKLQASLALSLSPSIQPERLSLVVDNLTSGLAKPGGQEMRLAATHGELHGRRAPDAAEGSLDIDLALALDAANLLDGGRAVGPQGADWTINSVIHGLPPTLVAGEAPLKTWAAHGGQLELRSGHMSLGGFSIFAKGSLAPDTKGLLNGDIKLVASGIEALMMPSATPIKGRGELLTLATAFALLGKSAPDTGGRGLDLMIDQGQLKFGGKPIGYVPPLF